MKKRGRFIVVEGLEGAGKSTAIQTINDYLKPFIPSIIVTREPGGTRLGETVRQLIKEKIENEAMESRAELLLMYAARVQLVEQVIQPALEEGSWVLADRFELSTFAYQGGGRHLDMQMIKTLSEFCLQGFKPDLTIFLDINPDLGLKRAIKRSTADRIEQESLKFFVDVFNGYHEALGKMDNVLCIDASQPMEIVQKSIILHLATFLAYDATT
jgi:dTMP kinase